MSISWISGGGVSRGKLRIKSRSGVLRLSLGHLAPSVDCGVVVDRFLAWSEG